MIDRRTYLRRLCAGGGVAALAGCVSEDGADENDGGSDGEDEQSDQQPATTGEGSTNEGSESTATLSSPPEAVDQMLREKDVRNYDGELADKTGQETAEITVGGGENGLVYAPPAVQVDPGTEVVWTWTGNGGGHNVVAREPADAFNSGELVEEQGATYTVTFEGEGNYIYMCQPHRAFGMWGAVVVGQGGPAEASGADDGES